MQFIAVGGKDEFGISFSSFRAGFERGEGAVRRKVEAAAPPAFRWHRRVARDVELEPIRRRAQPTAGDAARIARGGGERLAVVAPVATRLLRCDAATSAIASMSPQLVAQQGCGLIAMEVVPAYLPSMTEWARSMAALWHWDCRT